MKRGLRLTLFWLFTLAFFVLAPAAVLYTAGYRISSETGRIVRSGAISVSSTPRGADIYFNDADFGRDTPYIFKRVLPGEHKLELQREGYLSWQGVVDVEPNRTVNIEGIHLVKDGSDTEIVLEEETNLILHPNRDLAAYIERAENWLEVWQVDLRSGERFMKGRVLSLVEDEAELQWSSISEYLTLRIGSEVYLMQNEGIIDTLQIAPSDELYWHPQFDQVVVISGRAIDTYPVESDGFSSDSLLIVDAGSQLIEFAPEADSMRAYRLEEGERRLVAELAPDMLILQGVIGPYIVLQNQLGEFAVVNSSQNTALEFEARADIIAIDANRSEIVYTDGFAVFSYDLESRRETFYIREGKLVEHIHAAEQYIVYGLSGGEWYALERDTRANERNHLVLPWGNDAIIDSRFTQNGDDVFLTIEGGLLQRIGVYR